ncbi:MAG: hypothetical protein KBG15_14295 [Kofleriaceae bacterium]|nr:hypothetical protein [Kofleriaceae bacterium]
MQAYDQAHGVEAGAMAAAQVAAQCTVIQRSLANGLVKFEVILPSDAAAIVWAALHAAIHPNLERPANAGRGVEANGANGWDVFDHRNRIIDAQPARPTSSDVGQRRGRAALHDAHAALAITVTTNTSETGRMIGLARHCSTPYRRTSPGCATLHFDAGQLFGDVRQF